jgi:hypothetical protein
MKKILIIVSRKWRKRKLVEIELRRGMRGGRNGEKEKYVEDVEKTRVYQLEKKENEKTEVAA